jgi:hypothetical protein
MGRRTVREGLYARYAGREHTMSGFTKLDSEILTSTVWMELANIRLTWVTMLAMADKNGEVHASLPGLANQARVPLEDCEEAIKKFLAPDPYSRSKEYAGRRITEIDGGWVLLNHQKYKQKYSEEWKRELDAARIRKKRQIATDRDMSRTVANSREKLPIQIPDPRSQIEETTLARNPADAGFARGGKVDSEISVESGHLDLAAAPPAEVEGEERRSPATSPPPEPKKKRRDADSPSGRLFAYWRDEIWPRVGEGTYLESKADFIQLAAALRELSEAEVRKVFERAVEDPFWAGKPLKAICSTSALNSLRAHPNGTQPSTPRTGCQPWDELLAQAATNGGRETVKCLREYVSPRLENRTLVLEVPDRYRADYVERHLPEIESAALERFGLTVQLLVTPPAQEAVCLP